MADISYPKRKRQITTRLRRALLACAVVAAIIPVIVYFATAAVVERQENLSSQLITSVANSAELNATLIRLSDDTKRLSLLNDVAEVESSSELALARVEDLRAGFAKELFTATESPEAQKIAELLSDYKVSVERVADNRVYQLESLADIAAQKFVADRVLRRAKTEILSRTASISVDFERRMIEGSQSEFEGDGRAMASEFQSLLLYRGIAGLLDTIDERISHIDTSEASQNVEDTASDLRFATRGLATRIAKITDPELRSALARDTGELNLVLLSPRGMLALYREYRAEEKIGESIAVEQSKIAAELLQLSDARVTSTKADALEGSKEIADLVRDNRLAVLAASIFLVLLLLALLFFLVGRNFSRRIGGLTDSVLAIADGDTDFNFDIGGKDELTSMSDSLDVFRETRRNLIKTNEELEIRNQEVREVGTRLTTILDTTTSGIIAFDDDGAIIMVNAPARHFLGGISEPTPFAWPVTISFLDSEDLSQLETSKDPIKRALAGQSLKSEIALMERSADQEACYMRISSATVQNETSPVRCVVVLEDVSDAEKNRQQVERAGRLDALGQLTGGIAHDFNNLLATVEYAVELSIATGVNDKAKGYLKTAGESVRRGSELTARLLSFAKRQPARARSQKVADIMRDFRALVEPSIEEVVSLSFEDVPPDLYVYCDSGQLENALLNLVLNSRDAILREGNGDRIGVSVREVTEADGDFQERQNRAEGSAYRGVAPKISPLSEETGSTRYIEFAVTDNGPGMSREVKRRALDPFFTTKITNSGTGLGLSMVYGFIENSDGELRIYSEEGHGTTIRLLLPSGSSEGEKQGPVANLPVSIGKGELVLIVEDDVALRQIMAELVSSLGYSIEVSGSGREALKLIDEGFEFDLLLTDIVMPGGIGGFELGQEVRNRKPTMPIVYMSGYSGFTTAEMGTAIGMFVQKPCAPSELSQAMTTALTTNMHLHD